MAVWPYDEEGLARAIQLLRVEGRRGRCRPSLTWDPMIRADIAYGIDGILAPDRKPWKAAIRQPDHVTSGIRA